MIAAGEYIEQVRESRRIARVLGMWVLHSVAEEKNLEYLIGYLRYRIGDFDRRRQRQSKDSKRRNYLARRISYWRRALRWVGNLDPQTAQALAERLIVELEGRDSQESFSLVSEHECNDPRHDKDQRARREEKWIPGVGRPRLDTTRRPKVQLCGQCRGMGTIKAESR